jgi:D-lactate dehydrogenase
MKVVIFDTEAWERKYFDQLKDDHELVMLEESCKAAIAEQHADADVISVFIYSQLSSDVLEKFENLKLIATRSTGFDHIDRDWCTENDVKIANVPTYGENTVAEHTFALLLTISHHMEEAVDRTRKGDFSSRGLEGFDLWGRTFGVIGTGNIGRHVIRMAHGFGMRVLAFDVNPDEAAARDLDFEYVDMDRLLAESDIITLHVPGNEKTRHMISTEQFDKMKDGVVLLNTSRGKVIDMQALVRALATGKVSKAGLDVLPEEPVIREEAELLRSVYQRRHNLESLLADHVVLRLRNVIVTPHSAFRTREAIQRIIEVTIENIQAFADGEARNVINGERSAA